MHFEKLIQLPRPLLSNELEADMAGRCLDNIQVVHYVCTVLISVGENKSGRKQILHMTTELAMNKYCKNKTFFGMLKPHMFLFKLYL